MPSPLRRTKARVLTLRRSVANALKLTIASSVDSRSEKPISDSRSHNGQTLTISHPRPLRRAPFPTFDNVHAINRLPLELLAQIFIIGSVADPMLPVTVSHVCRKWRRLALRTPALWRRITLDSRVDMWKERLRRAKACPLDIQLVPWFISYSRKPRIRLLDMATVQWYMHVVMPYIHGWRTLDIVFSDYSPYLWNAALSGCCSSNKAVRAPLLEELVLLYRTNDDTKEFLLFSGYTPHLRRVTLDGIKLTWVPSLFGNLTFLDYAHHGFSRGYCATREVLNMLRVSSRLVELRILFPQKRPLHHYSHSDPLELAPVMLMNLENLHIKAEGDDIPFELAHLVSLFQTPALKQLSLTDVNQWRSTFPSVRPFFYTYSIPETLHTLRAEYGWCDPNVLVPLLPTLPRLQRFISKQWGLPMQILNLR